MSFSKLTAMRFRDMFRRKEFFYTSLVVLVLFLLPAFLDLLLLYGNDMSSVRPPWYYFGLSLSNGMVYYSPVVFQCICLIAIPLFSCMAYSYCFLDESRYGVKNIVLSKASRSSYYLSSALTVFIGGFLVIFIPMVLNQLVYLAAVPFSAYASVKSSVPDYLDITYRNITYFTVIANNHPYLFNLLYCFIPSFLCSLFGLLSFSFSLFFKKNKFLVITLPFIIYVVSNLVLSLFYCDRWMLAFIIMPTFGRSVSCGMKISHLVIVIIGLLLINMGALLAKIRYARDEL